MTRSDLSTSAVFAVAIGAALLWLGARMFRRPVETNQQVIDAVRRGRPLPSWARPHPDTVRPIVRGQGAVLVAVGAGLLVLGAYMWLLSKR
jgi:hypothetical protein